jgi:hypothetical protein
MEDLVVRSSNVKSPVVACLVWCCAAHAHASSTALTQASAIARTATSTAVSAPYALIIDGAAEGMTCNGDTSIQADGNTADTDGLIAMVSELNALPGGGEISLPIGQCEINREIDIPVSANQRFSGAGIGVTTLEFFTPPSAASPVQNGLVFSVTRSANVTVDDLTVSRRAGANRGLSFIGTSVSIIANSNSSAGNATVANLKITGPSTTAQSDGWNNGLLEINIPAPVINNVTVDLPSWSNIPNPGRYLCMTGPVPTSCAIHMLPSPTNVVTTPSNLGFGVGAGVALGGNGNGAFQVRDQHDSVR